MNPKSFSLSLRKPILLFLTSVLATGFSFGQNTIADENKLTGNPIAEWGVNSSVDFKNVRLNGYATGISVNKGTTVRFKINSYTVNGAGDTVPAPYTLKIYRLGYYKGMGARIKANLGTFPGTYQPAGNADLSTGLLDCGNWSESANWAVPSDAVSGFYVVKLQSSEGVNNIVFIVRNDAGHSDIFFQVNDATWQAYNGYGGNYLYNGTTNFPGGHAVKVSYNRPFFVYNTGFNGEGRGANWYMNDAYPMIRWIERNGYDVSYTSNVDVARSGNLLLNHKIFVTDGHDEYWSKEQRDNVEAARAAGVNMAFFTGNETYWKTRWEDNFQTLVCYKEGLLADGTQGEVTCGGKCDPNPTVWTGLWRTGSAYDAPIPENALTGQISWDQPGTGPDYSAPMMVPDTFKNIRFWRNTSVANLTAGQTATLASQALGYEFDYEQFPDSYPHGRITMSSTVANGHTHKLSLYRYYAAASSVKPLIFGAGTVQWAWGLDNNHFGGDNSAGSVNKDMQQATANLFADMGVQAATLQTDLVAASASTDFTAPVSKISSPVNGASLAANTAVSISGTVTDAGGATAGVEVSVDGGDTWELAKGTNNWTFSWTPTQTGTYTIKSRGYDDSGNMEDPQSEGTNKIIVTVNSSVCPCHIFTTQTPSGGTGNDGQPLELGVKFRSSVAGTVTGVRFYKTSGNSGTHTGELYSSTGTRLAQAVFSGESATGWQTATFNNPVSIAANTTYVAAYFSSSGNYTGTANYFGSAIVNSPITGLADGTDGHNGVYLYSATPAFPTSFSGNNANYWVDVVFSNGPVTPTANAGPDQTIVLPASSVTLDGSSSTGTITSYAWTKISGPNNPVITTAASVTTTVTGLIQGTYVFQLAINGGGSTSQVTIKVNPAAPPVANAGSNQTITLPTSSVTLDGSGSTGSITSYAWTKISGPNNPVITTAAAVTTTVTGLVQGTYVFQLSLNGGASTSQVTVNVVTAAAGTGIFTTQTPSGGTGNDGQPLELGVKFRSSVAGTVTGVRFYKTSGNSGTHTGELYSSTGTRLAQAVFSGESATGWQTATFNNPVSIAANTTYVAAYFSSSGNYTGTANYFGSAIVNSPITGLADGTDGHNAVYLYSATPAFPTSFSGNNANYWVDVVFSNGPVTPTANAGPDQTIVLPASSVTLDGSGSTGTITSYAWTKISGPNNPVITTAASVTTTVTGLIQGTYVFQLAINGGGSTSQVTIKVNPAAPPVANAGSNQTITLPTSSVTLDGSGSTGSITSYAWTKISGPNNPVITTAAAVTTTVTGLVQGTYVFQLSLNGGASTSQVTVNVVTAAAGTGIFTTQTSSSGTSNDGRPLELGVKFRSSVAGFVTGVRFYKTSGNSGTHTGELYSSTGTRLAQAVFSGESATGWQTATFNNPVSIAANTTYVAAYFSSSGNYTGTANYFGSAIVNSPITGLADGTDGHNGVYLYSATPAFPTSFSGNNANYWVDVVFSVNAPAGQSAIFGSNAGSFEHITAEGSVADQLTYFLGQNYPNPVYMNTRINYSIPVNGRVLLTLFDMQGRQIKTLLNESKDAGRYYLEVNTSGLAQGLYYYRMESGNFRTAKRLIVQ